VRNSILVSAVAVAACSSSPKPPPEQPKPEPPPAADAEPAGPPPVAEAELCGKIDEEISAQMPPDQFGKLKPIVDKHCPTWPEKVRRCLYEAEDDKGQGCLDEIPDQRDAFFHDLQVAFVPPPECSELKASASLWTTFPDGIADDDKGLIADSVGAAVETSCRTNAWPEDARTCVANASSDPKVCLAADAASQLDADLKARAALFAKAAGFKPTDKKITCDKAAAAHYGAAQWKDQMVGADKKAKAKAIKDATKSFTKACKDESWTPFKRACVVAAASAQERAYCLAPTWGYPPGDLVQPTTMTKSTGIPECDAYVETVKHYGGCDKLPQAAKDAVAKSVEEMEASWNATMDDEAKKAAAEGCKAGNDALRDAAKQIGCTL
jgi:hypothetical protein